MSPSIARVLLPIAAIIVLGACQNASDDRIDRLEARVAKLEHERTGRPSSSPTHQRQPITTSSTPPPALAAVVAESADNSVPAAPTDAEAEPDIQQHCTSKWPTDFEMQAYCKKQQREALIKLQATPPADVPVQAFATIRRHCMQKWPADFEMREYCERQQVAGYRESSR